MDKQQEKKDKGIKKPGMSKSAIVLSAVLTVVIFVCCRFLLKDKEPELSDNAESFEASVSETTSSVEKLTDSINIPGYSSLTFVSGETEQNMSFSNPEVNFCWFRISLVLEDGRTLFTSNLFGPGELSEPIVLNFPLEKGEYERTTILYECFADEAGAIALNGAETTLTIFVE